MHCSSCWWKVTAVLKQIHPVGLGEIHSDTIGMYEHSEVPRADWTDEVFLSIPKDKARAVIRDRNKHVS